MVTGRVATYAFTQLLVSFLEGKLINGGMNPPFITTRTSNDGSRKSTFPLTRKSKSFAISMLKNIFCNSHRKSSDVALHMWYAHVHRNGHQPQKRLLNVDQPCLWPWKMSHQFRLVLEDVSTVNVQFIGIKPNPDGCRVKSPIQLHPETQSNSTDVSNDDTSNNTASDAAKTDVGPVTSTPFPTTSTQNFYFVCHENRVRVLKDFCSFQMIWYILYKEMVL